MPDAVIVATARTPMGRYGGQLKEVRPDDLAAVAIKEAVRRAGVDPADVADVILGCANQAGEDNRNVARMALLLAGFPVEVPGQTVNRLCGSGMQATIAAAREIQAGAADVIVAGGVESMTRAPWVMAKPDGAYPRGPQTAYDTALGWRLVNPRMAAMYGTLQMGETAERVAQKYEISREDQDAFALRSHRRAIAAQESGRLAEEIVAVDGIGQDEGPRVDTSLEALEKAGLEAADMGVVELNEAFASQSLACIRLLDLDDERVNVNGGAIALGHPLGSSGARLVGTLVREMEHRDAEYGLATMCIGVGQGIASIWQKI